MDQKKWKRWVMQTATRWEDLSGIVNDTGIEKIDREHRRLVEYILDMDEFISRNETSRYNSNQLKEQTQLFDNFIAALKQHYATEEYFINRYELAGLPFQQKEHQAVLDKFETVFSDFRKGILSTYQHLRMGLIEEIIQHINFADLQTFDLIHFLPALRKAEKWDDISEVIKTTGIPFVDDEHKLLTERIIDLNLVIRKIEPTGITESQKQEMVFLINDLYKLSNRHFNNEIRFLTKYQLPTENQKENHDLFLDAVIDNRNRILEDTHDNIEGFMGFLFNWWVNHINGIDYVEFHFSRIAGPVFSLSESSDDFKWLIRKTGIDSVDAEHANLIGILLKLAQPVASGKAPVDLRKELGRIADFAKAHFRHEEEIMKKLKLPGLEVHMDAHSKLLGYIADAMSHIVSGRSRVSSIFLKRVMGWWVEHTNGMDYDTFIVNKPRQ